MPRKHVKPVEAVAASPAMVAAMLNIRPDDLAKAIAEKKITVHQIGIRRRIVIADAVAWLRTWKEVQPRKYKPRKSNVGVSHDDNARAD